MIEDKDLKCSVLPLNPEDIAYSGQSTKHRFEIVSPGFNMDTDDWEGTLVIESGQSISLSNNDVVKDSEGNHYLCITSEESWVGKSVLKITARVPDEAFNANIRIEKFKVPFVTYVKL